MNDKELMNDLEMKSWMESGMEEPSSNFTHRVMQQINAIETAKRTKVQPLIPAWVWIAISVVVAALLIWSIYDVSTQRVNFEFHLPSAHISSVAVYALLSMGVMVGVMTAVYSHYLSPHND